MAMTHYRIHFAKCRCNASVSPPKKVVRYSANTLAAATAWARVEAVKHYPADVLAGAAPGHFLTTVIHDSMMGLD